MAAQGAIQAGDRYTSSTTGSVVNLVARDCVLLGFYASASTTLIVYDDAATGTSNPVLNISACAVGWNAFPVALKNGLAVNQGAQLYFVAA